jgi:hypothetical protein
MRKYFSGFPSALLLTAALFTGVSAFAQEPGQMPEQQRPERQENGVSAGGNWMVFESEDAMTAAKLVRFELESNNMMPDSDRRSKIILYCRNGKLDLSDFRPNLRMSGPNRPGFWGQPQMEVTVRVDNAHDHKGWNWVRGQFLSMDKGTARELIGAKLFRVEFLSRRGPQIAEFSPAGLDLGKVRRACDITPKKP